MKKILKKMLVAVFALFIVLPLSAQSSQMIFVEGGTFQMGDASQKDSPVHTVTVSNFDMSKYKVSLSEFGSITGKWPINYQNLVWHTPVPSSEYDSIPAFGVTWYEAIVYCNKRSVAEGLTPCYASNGSKAAVTNATNFDKDWQKSTGKLSLQNVTCDWNADGYRLPREEEWELAARKTKNGLQRGDLASGQSEETASPLSLEECVAWIPSNSKGTRTVGTAGNPFMPEAMPAPGSGNPNFSGLFDMSGNVMEYCWDWMDSYKDVEDGSIAAGPEYGLQRVARGGSFSSYTPFIYCGDRYSYDPNEVYNYMGFRICSSITGENL